MGRDFHSRLPRILPDDTTSRENGYSRRTRTARSTRQMLARPADDIGRSHRAGLPRLVGPGHAMDMLFAAETVDADHAFRIGLLTRLVDKGGALAEAKRLVGIYEKRGPISLAFAKRAVQQGLQMDLASAVAYEYSLVTGIYGTDDKREGVSAFLEKRDAKFTGR